MSFFLEVAAPDLSWKRAAAVVGACNEGDGLRTRLPRRPLVIRRARSPVIWIDDRWGEEELLEDDAGWNAPTWSMNSRVIPRLVKTLECLVQTVPGRFTFVAGWDGFRTEGCGRWGRTNF